MPTEPLVPTGTLANNGWSSYSLGNIDTDDTTWQDPTNNTTDPDLHLSFPTPSGDLTGGPTDQVIHVKARRFEVGQTGVPTLRIEIWESGGGSALAASSELNLSDSEVDLTYSWDADILSDISGVDCEIKIFISHAGGAPGARCSGSIQYVEWTASYTPPTFTGSSSITTGAATASASGTFTAPVYTGNATITIGSVTASSSGTYDSGTFTGSSIITVGVVTASGSGTFDSGTFTGSSTITIGAVTASSSGTFVAAAPDDELPAWYAFGMVWQIAYLPGGATIGGQDLQEILNNVRVPDFDIAAGTYTGSAAITIASVLLSSSGTFTAPVYTGNAAITVGVVTSSASGTFNSPIYTGNSNITIAAVSATGIGQYTSFSTGIATITVGSIVLSSNGTFTAPVYTGNSNITVGAVTASGSGQYGQIFTGSATISIGAAIASSFGQYTSFSTGASNITIGSVIASSSGTFTVPTYTGSAAITIGATTATGAGSFAVGIVTGSANITISPAAATASGIFVGPTYTGSANIFTPTILCVGNGFYGISGTYTGSATIIVPIELIGLGQCIPPLTTAPILETFEEESKLDILDPTPLLLETIVVE